MNILLNIIFIIYRKSERSLKIIHYRKRGTLGNYCCCLLFLGDIN